ncbi:MerR family DNA-binding transcriptional regulator [Massilia sp. CCM 9210]|uniref:MerR family transcriptional regulator n=1 Tax=Massilia scottii TaxID=3057166 RepID=UPI002796AADB|nr:MerR family transcriptional regulator [Massilia sp. CCM 9210]MDQ1818103.1 MerR family DNA-binding transcriptional regulator [Massilia sp. CCM 9210]
MKIGELSRRCDVSIRMLRYYEAEGLLTPRRTETGYRDYAQVDEQTVERIKLLGSAGMTLATIKQFASCIRGEGRIFEPCDELRTTLHGHLRAIDQKAEQLLQNRRVLEKFILDVES